MTEAVIGCLLVLVLAIGLGALEGLIFMFLWNWLAPMFWAAAPIFTFWQAWGVCILLNLIGNFFKSSKSSK